MPSHDRPHLRPLPTPTRRPTTTGADRAMHLYLLPPAADTGRAGHDPTAMTTRRALGSAAQKEPTAMYSAHQGPDLPQIYAESRRHDLMAEAARARLVNQATRGDAARRSATAAAVATLRRQIGTLLVQAGERVQGAGACPPADAGLRTAR